MFGSARHPAEALQSDIFDMHRGCSCVANISSNRGVLWVALGSSSGIPMEHQGKHSETSYGTLRDTPREFR